MSTYDDDYLHFWGDVYVANPSLKARGIVFEVFLQAPSDILYAHTYVNVAGDYQADPDAVNTEHRPLLPVQRQVANRLAQAESLNEIARYWDGQLVTFPMRRRGEHYVEPLHRHAYDVSRGPKIIREGK